MSQVADDPLTAGREAAARGAWHEAYDKLKPVQSELDGDDLEMLAEAAWWLGNLDEAIGLRERAHGLFLKQGDKMRAAQLALVLSGDFFGKADLAVSAGWIAKAERLLDGMPESVGHGYLALFRALNKLGTDMQASIDYAEAALAIGMKFESRDLEALAIMAKGRALVMRGDATEGLALLDEATAAAISGELRPFSTGIVYCVTITSCNGLGDYRRAAEWTAAANRWAAAMDVTGFPGACRVHQATIKRLQGDWPGAEEQAVQACQELQGFDAWTTAAGFYEIGEIRRRRGDFAAAEESYRQSKEWGRDPQPGLALLRLAQGKVDAAVSAITRAMDTGTDPIGMIRRLPAQIEIALAAGDLTTARTAAAELEELTERVKVGEERTPAFQASVCMAWGQIGLAEGDAAAAVKQLEHAVELWRDIGIPYETAEAQMHLGLALRKVGDEDAAVEELTAARSTFQRLGAVLDAQRVSELLGEVPVTRTFMFTDIVGSTEARRGARRGEVGEAPRLARPNAPRAAPGGGRRRDQADRRRVLRGVRLPGGGGRGGRFRAAGARCVRGRRAGRAGRVARGRRVCQGRGRLRRTGRPRGGADRGARGARARFSRARTRSPTRRSGIR